MANNFKRLRKISQKYTKTVDKTDAGLFWNFLKIVVREKEMRLFFFVAMLMSLSCTEMTTETKHAQIDEKPGWNEAFGFDESDWKKMLLINHIFANPLEVSPTNTDQSDSALLEKPFKISYTNTDQIDSELLEKNMREALDLWLDALRNNLGDAGKDIISAEDIDFIDETSKYDFSGRRPLPANTEDTMDSLTIVHFKENLLSGGGHVKPYVDENDRYLYVSINVTKDEDGSYNLRKLFRTLVHEFGHVYGLDDTASSDATRDRHEADWQAHHGSSRDSDEGYGHYSCSARPNIYNPKTRAPHAHSIMSYHYNCFTDADGNLNLAPDDICGILEVYADYHLAAGGQARQDLYKEVQDRMMEQHGFECVWSN